MIKKREFKNANSENVVIEEKMDDNNNTVYYKQWNNNILVVHHEWGYDCKNKILYRDNIDGFWEKTSYHYFKGFEISNSWTNRKFKGELVWKRFYYYREYIGDGLFKVISRYISNHGDQGWIEKIGNIVDVHKK